MAVTTKAAWGDASKILSEAGVTEDKSYYREFTAADQKAALTVAMRIQAAWKANDPDMFADMFTENGSLLMKDRQLHSREEIRGFMAGLFSGSHRGARVIGWPVEVQFLSGEVAMVITEGGIVMPGEADVADTNLIRSTWVIAKKPEGLKLVSHQSSPIKS
jgi:uncharacterized protein (TIGR02246 family)